eukprot:gb/GECG01014582.1/.p1 GENE.gb/GECG01014582.1/~~gb/GECG01014582.1/.p1  ORF type:complete len:104 (+),score=13.01 gb/GECG01014582.1/:1-312(+)
MKVLSIDRTLRFIPFPTDRFAKLLAADLRSREPSGEPKSLHVINIETKDDTKSADQGAKYALQFAEMAAKLPTNTTLDEGMDHLLPKIQKEIGADPLYVEHRL